MSNHVHGFGVTDTDSFIYEFQNVDDIYAEISENAQEYYDTSAYPQPKVFNIPPLNKKKPEYMKDENNGLTMTEFVGLRSKMYSVRVNGNDAMKKAKGVKKYILKKDITFDEYKRCIDEHTIVSRSQNSIRSIRHEVLSIKQHNIALSPFDDKRKICENKIDTLPWGHYSIEENN